MLKLSNTEHRTRLRLYKQGLNDYEVASRLGINESTIRRWRNISGRKDTLAEKPAELLRAYVVAGGKKYLEGDKDDDRQK